MPCHGTRTVLAETPLSSRAARRASWGTPRAKALVLTAFTQSSALSPVLPRYPLVIRRALLSHPSPRHLAGEEKRTLALRHRLLGRRAGVGRRVSRIRQERSVGFVVVLLGGLSGDLLDGTRDGILRAEVVVALGSHAVRGAVRLDANKSGTGESIAAGDYCVCGDFVAGGDCGEGRGVLGEKR